MSFFGAIGNFFKKVFGWTIQSDPFKQLVSGFMPVAIQAVTSLSSISSLSNDQKRKQAMQMVADSAKGQGLQFADHMIALLVELAVSKMKGTIGEG